jgi:hypothetical protein
MEFTASLFVDHATGKVHRLSIVLVPMEGSHVADGYLIPSGESAFDHVFQALTKQNGRFIVSDALLSAYQTADTLHLAGILILEADEVSNLERHKRARGVCGSLFDKQQAAEHFHVRHTVDPYKAIAPHGSCIY